VWAQGGSRESIVEAIEVIQAGHRVAWPREMAIEYEKWYLSLTCNQLCVLTAITTVRQKKKKKKMMVPSSLYPSQLYILLI
jgi:hypothetical protein